MMKLNAQGQIRTTRRADAEAVVNLAQRRRWFGTPMIAENWATLLTPGLRAIFFQQVDAGDRAGEGVGQLFNEVGSSKSKEDTLGIGGLGDVPEYNGSIEYDSFDPQYKKTFEHVEYAKGIAVERKLIADDLYNVINQRPRMLGMTFARTRRKHKASVFSKGFSTVKTGDGKALFATDHPTSKQRGGSQSNKGVLPFTYDNVIATRQAMLAFTDDRGENANINPDTLVVPLGLEEAAWTFANSQNKPGTGNNDGNFVRSQGWNVIVDRYLTDANDWFMADSEMARMHLWWFNREATEFAVDPTSDFNLIAKFRGYMRYSFGPDDWRWAFGHQVP